MSLLLLFNHFGGSGPAPTLPDGRFRAHLARPGVRATLARPTVRATLAVRRLRARRPIP